MKQSLKGVRAEIALLEGPQSEAWRRETWKDSCDRMRDRISRSSREVLVLTPYAEVLVPVEKADEVELRRCSICLN